METSDYLTPASVATFCLYFLTQKSFYGEYKASRGMIKKIF